MNSVLIRIPLVLFLAAATSCAGVKIAPYERNTASVPRDDRAKAIFASAKKCWSTPEKRWTSGVTVDSAVTLEGISISARYYSEAEVSEMRPFFQFSVKGDEKSSTVELLDWTAKYPKKADFRSDAKRWLDGDYTCKNADA
jgi:hypothetical protein